MSFAYSNLYFYPFYDLRGWQKAIREFLEGEELVLEMKAVAQRNANLGVSIPHFTIMKHLNDNSNEKQEIEGVHGCNAFLRAFGSSVTLADSTATATTAAPQACNSSSSNNKSTTATMIREAEEIKMQIEGKWEAQNLLRVVATLTQNTERTIVMCMCCVHLLKDRVV